MYDSSCMKELKKGKGGDEKQGNPGATASFNDQGVSIKVNM
jgi:hypothetical protein